MDHRIEFIHRENIRLHHLKKEERALQALLMYRPPKRVSFADALLWATAKSTNTTTIYSLDRRFPDNGPTIRETS